jgi:hypothetical protein
LHSEKKEGRGERDREREIERERSVQRRRGEQGSSDSRASWPHGRNAAPKCGVVSWALASVSGEGLGTRARLVHSWDWGGAEFGVAWMGQT